MSKLLSSVKVFWTAQPSEPSEREFLSRLKSDLEAAGVDAIILCNFFTHHRARQVDFFSFRKS